MTLTIPMTLAIFRKCVSAICQGVIMAANNTGLLTIYGIKNTRENYL